MSRILESGMRKKTFNGSEQRMSFVGRSSTFYWGLAGTTAALSALNACFGALSS